jgi:hypothetical protein
MILEGFEGSRIRGFKREMPENDKKRTVCPIFKEI